MSIKLSLCIPMYNEEKIAADTARTLASFLDGKFDEGEYEIIFSNDGSVDACARKVEELGLSGVRVVGYPDNRGKGCAVRTAVMAARGDYVLYTDCDLAYGTEKIYEMYSFAQKNDCDIVIGSRNLDPSGYDGYTPMRKFMSKAYIKVISIFAGFDHSDSQCGIKCLRGDVAHKIFSECTVNSFAFDLEMLFLADAYGFRITEMPVKIINHRESESKVNPVKDTLKMLRDVSDIKKRHKDKKKSCPKKNQK